MAGTADAPTVTPTVGGTTTPTAPTNLGVDMTTSDHVADVLVPLLFSGAVNLHPVAIICAVLLFGGLWGFWGIFFAIPLATLFKAVLDAWPRKEPVVAPLL